MKLYRKLIFIAACGFAMFGRASSASAEVSDVISVDFARKTADVGDKSIEEWLNANAASLTAQEREAMMFLYAYMALPDWGGYTPEFYLENVRASLRAREEMPWGKKVPEREFRHFVLPVRVNNEGLDHSRTLFYDELKERVKNLTMEEAILEVNHWCHEKATYQPSDGRTSNPLSTVSQAIGRCGEESTFTVAALRAVGIPARQIYTPRWAHTDDNHAWVEAWADGKWHFLGACEPEPILDLAWFNAPASRGMLMSTKVFGRYDGPEEVLETTPANTVINVTSNYAPTGILKVKVVDTDGKAVENAVVRFSLYNYAEFYPVAVRKTGADGTASLLGGIGDLIVWATDGENFGVVKASPAASEPVTVILDKGPDWTGRMEFDIVPPAPSASLPTPTQEQRRENDRRFAREDSIRFAYTSTFVTPSEAAAVARKLGTDSVATVRILVESRGNHKALAGFLSSLPAKEREKGVRLLMAVSEKDRRDISTDALADHLAAAETESPMFDAYVMNPRITTEPLTPWRSPLLEGIAGEADVEAFRRNPMEWAAWCRENIAVDTVWNQARIPMDPMAVWRLRRADSSALRSFFVAGARAMGIPSRIDPVTGKTQFAGRDGDWVDVKFEEQAQPTATPKGKVELLFTPTAHTPDPRYYYQFTLSAIRDGQPHLLEFDEAETASGLNSSAERLDEGRYMVLSGQRLADGGVLARAEVFNLDADAVAEVPLEIRNDPTAIQVIGSFNSENLYHDLAEDKDKSLLSTTGRGYYLLGLIKPGHEPSVHNLNDISAVASEFDKWGKKCVILLADAEEASRFDASRFPNLPKNTVFGHDIDGTILNELTENLNLPDSERPLFVIADTFNRVVYVSQGYTIGLGDTISSILRRLKE